MFTNIRYQKTGDNPRRLLMASVHGLQQLGGVRLELQVLAAETQRASTNVGWKICGTSELFHGEIHGNPPWKFYGISWGKSRGTILMRSKWRFANLHVWLQAKKLWQNAGWFSLHKPRKVTLNGKLLIPYIRSVEATGKQKKLKAFDSDIEIISCFLLVRTVYITIINKYIHIYTYIHLLSYLLTHSLTYILYNYIYIYICGCFPKYGYPYVVDIPCYLSGFSMNSRRFSGVWICPWWLSRCVACWALPEAIGWMGSDRDGSKPWHRAVNIKIAGIYGCSSP